MSPHLQQDKSRILVENLFLLLTPFPNKDTAAIFDYLPRSEALSDGRATTSPEMDARTQAVESVNFIVVCENFGTTG